MLSYSAMAMTTISAIMSTSTDQSFHNALRTMTGLPNEKPGTLRERQAFVSTHHA